MTREVELVDALRGCVEHMEWSTTQGKAAYEAARRAIDGVSVGADGERIEFLENLAKQSRTGISLDWSPEEGYRFMSFHKIDAGQRNVRAAIDAAMALRR